MRSFPYVGSFRGHTAMIIYLTIHPSDNLLISASTDSTIRLWRIETFHEMYRYSVIDSLRNVVLVNATRLFYATSARIQVLELNIPHTLFTLIGSKIHHIQRIRSVRRPPRIFVLGEDGGARIISPVHGNILTTAFPIITHKPVSFLHNPIEDQIYVLLEDGSIMVICTETNPCKTTHLLQAFKYEDRVQSMEIVYWKKPESNQPITGLLLVAHVDGRIRLVRGEGYAFDSVYSHRGEIQHMVACPYDPQNVCDLLTFNSDLSLTAWKVEESHKYTLTLHQVKDFVFNRKINHVTIMRNNILVAIRKRLIFVKLEQISKFNKEPSRDERHLANITDLSSCPTLSIFASSSQDGALKIWDTDGCQLREITFDASLSALCFANARGDILIGFQNNVHLIGIIDYLPKFLLERILKDEAQQFEEDEKEYCIPFDPVLKFWYDPTRVENVNVSESQLALYQQPPPASANHVDFMGIYADPPHIRNFKKSESGILDSSPSFQLCNPSESVCKDPSAAFKQSVQRTIEVLNIIRKIDRMCLNGDGVNIVDELMAPDAIPREKSPPVIERQSSELEIRPVDSIETFQPCAPDGFIPNSIIRERYEIKPPENIPLQLWDPHRQFDAVLIEEEEDLEYIEESEEEFDENKKQVWLTSDDDSDFTLTPFSLNNSPVTKAPKETKQKEKKKVTIEKAPPVAKQPKEKNVPKKLVHEVKPKGDVVRKVKTPEEVKPVEDTDKEELLIPYPFDLFYEEYWFPKKVGFEVGPVIRVLTTKLESIPFLYLGGLMDCILKVHQFSPLTDRLLDNLIATLFKLLTHAEAGVRHLATKALTGLGVNRKDIVLKLVPCLADTSEKVKDEVKGALRSLAGIIDADSLVETLKDYEAFIEDPKVPNDAEVIESFKGMIIERRDSLKERMATIYEKFESSSNKMSAWVDYILKPTDYGEIKQNSIKIKRRRRSTKVVSRKEYASSLTNTTFNRDIVGTPDIAGLPEDGRDTTSLVSNRADPHQTPDPHADIQQRVQSDILQPKSPQRESKSLMQPKLQLTESSNAQPGGVPEDANINGNSISIGKDEVLGMVEDGNNFDLDKIPVEKALNGDVSNKNDTTNNASNKEAGNQSEVTSNSTNRNLTYSGNDGNTKNCSDINLGLEISDELDTCIPEITVNITEKCDSISAVNDIASTDLRKNSHHTAGLLDYRYKGNTGQNDIDSDASCESIAHQPEDVMPNMNKVLFENIDRTVETAIANLAPNLCKKFDTTGNERDNRQSEILKELRVDGEGDARVVQETRMVDSSGIGFGDVVNSRERWQFALKDQSDSRTHIDDHASVVQKWNKMKKECDKKTIDSILTLEHIAVTTAISVLRGRRKNSALINDDGILSNEVLNDITMLLHLLAKKGIKRYASVKRMMKQVRGLRNDVMKSGSRQYLKPQMMSVDNLLPLSIRQSMVRGVDGERIVSGLHVLPPIQKCGYDERNYGVIKAIPERYGTKTGSHNGCTKYGKFGFQWTTFTSNYDMGVNNLFRDDIKKKKENTVVKKRYRYDVFDNRKTKMVDGFSVRNTCQEGGKKKSHVERIMLRDQPNRTEKSPLNTRVALPKIPRDAYQRDGESKMKYAPPPPNTAEEALRRSAKLEIYTPT